MKVKIEGGEIVIRLKIKDLPVIVDAGPHGDLMKVSDKKVFARELVSALKQEEEDGTTVVHRAFDDAILAVFESGAEGVEFKEPPNE